MAKRKYICPKCGGRTGADILYGYPNWELVKDDVKAGYLVIGGCCVDQDNPDRECIDCGYQWQINRRKPQYSDDLDPIPTLFVLEIGGIARPSYRIEWRDGELTCLKGQSMTYEALISKSLNREDWLRFWTLLLACEVSLWDWKSRYDNPKIMDGIQWELTIVQSQYKKRIVGSNAYPGWDGPDWSRSREFSCLLSAVNTLVGHNDFNASRPSPIFDTLIQPDRLVKSQP